MNNSSKDRLNILKKQIAELSYEYHVLDKPSQSDAVYDGLMTELKEIESQHPELVTSDSPSQRVGNEVSKGFSSVNHVSRMLSLNDVFSEDDVTTWIARMQKLMPSQKNFSFYADVKKDGLACSLIYIDGVFNQAVTRGDGFKGEDVTDNVRTISSVPLRLRNVKETNKFLAGRLEIRGEIVMYKKDFIALNEQREKSGMELFANPRNTAAGTIRQLDSKLVAARKLHFLAYDILPENTRDISTHHEVYELLSSLGFKGAEYGAQLTDTKAISEYIHKWSQKRESLPYEIDGLVIKIDQRDLYDKAGIVGKNPRAAVAFKFPAEQSTTIVKDIFVSIGRTGAATPVAILAPVKIAGSTVQMATLHNDAEIARKDIRIGDTVIVHKAGDVIPEVVEPMIKMRTGHEKVFHMPTNCPECNTKLIKEKAGEAIWRCPNLGCPARSQKHIEHFASKGAIDIEGLGEKNVIALIEAGLVKDQADIYALTFEQIRKLDRFADISAQKLIEAIKDKKNPPLERLIFGLGIRHVGIQTAIDLANTFHSIDGLQQASLEDIAAVNGVGDVVAESIVAWFSDQKNQELLDKFKNLHVIAKHAQKAKGPLSGLKFAITGSLLEMSRDIAADQIRGLGGVFQSALGKDTDYLVVGENVGATKLKKANEYGTKQIDEKSFTKMLS